MQIRGSGAAFHIKDAHCVNDIVAEDSFLMNLSGELRIVI